MEHRSCVPSGSGVLPGVWDSAARVQWVSSRLAWAWAAPSARLGDGALVVLLLALTVPRATMERSAWRTEPTPARALVLEGSTARLPQRLACWYVCCGYCQTRMSNGGLSFACVCVCVTFSTLWLVGSAPSGRFPPPWARRQSARAQLAHPSPTASFRARSPACPAVPYWHN